MARPYPPPPSPYRANLAYLNLADYGLTLDGAGYVYRETAPTVPVAYVAAYAAIRYVAYGLTPNAYVLLAPGLTYASAIEVTLGALYGRGVTPPRTPRALRAAARRLAR